MKKLNPFGKIVALGVAVLMLSFHPLTYGGEPIESEIGRNYVPVKRFESNSYNQKRIKPKINKKTPYLDLVRAKENESDARLRFKNLFDQNQNPRTDFRKPEAKLAAVKTTPKTGSEAQIIRQEASQIIMDTRMLMGKLEAAASNPETSQETQAEIKTYLEKNAQYMDLAQPAGDSFLNQAVRYISNASAYDPLQAGRENLSEGEKLLTAAPASTPSQPLALAVLSVASADAVLTPMSVKTVVSYAGDYDGNGVVDNADHLVWRQNFGAAVTPGTKGDGNRDGTVDAADYVVWRNNLGAIFPLAPNPFAGDYNRDGLVDGADYVAWRGSFGTAVTPGMGADGNKNGVVDNADYTVWRDHFGSIIINVTGDYNQNGVVDNADYTSWRGQFGARVTPGTGADGNKNGVVDAGDYVVWRDHFGNNLVNEYRNLVLIRADLSISITQNQLQTLNTQYQTAQSNITNYNTEMDGLIHDLNSVVSSLNNIKTNPLITEGTRNQILSYLSDMGVYLNPANTNGYYNQRSLYLTKLQTDAADIQAQVNYQQNEYLPLLQSYRNEITNASTISTLEIEEPKWDPPIGTAGASTPQDPRPTAHVNLQRGQNLLYQALEEILG